MGMIDRFIGIGSTVTAVGNAASGVAEILTPSATRRMELEEEAYARAISEHEGEFAVRSVHWFDAAMNGLNRLPRPLLTLGTIGLFIHAMVDPVSFSERMEGLALVPEPLWWLMGAIVSFYFGAREAHYFRHRVWPGTKLRTKVTAGVAAQDDGWQAPAPPPGLSGTGPDDGWRAPAAPVAGGVVTTELEHRAADPGIAGPALPEAPGDSAAPPGPTRDGFSDNAALRDWAAGMGPAV